MRVCLLLMAAFFATASMRINLSMGITCMVNSTAFASEELKSFYKNESIDHSNDVCKPIVNEKVAKQDGYEGTLLWSPSRQSLLFSASFYGGLVTMAFAGYLADKYGPKLILLAAALDCVVFTMMGPFLADRSYWSFFASRAFMGIGIGCIQPCINSMAALWFPASEKSTVAALYTTGNQLAASLTSFFVAELCLSSFGWPSIFYIFGGVGLLWALVWWIFVSNAPKDNRWMGEAEKKFLEHENSTRKNKDMFRQNSLPFRHLFCNSTMQSIYCCQFAFSLCATIVQSFLPTYFKEHLYLPIHLNGLYNIVPFIAQIISKNIMAVISDYLKKRDLVDANVLVKFFQGFGSFGVSITLILLATLPSCENPFVALYLLAAYGFFFAGAIPGFFTALMSVAPPYAGTISSFSTIYATLASLAGPIIISVIDALDWPNKWMTIFGFCSIVQLFAGFFFVLCGEAKVQSWAKPKDSIDLTAAAC
ncbi:unnamed protein product, partial [Mesorhabditis belari]|uniref:Major facilitator superfamily (MFS) profile domain-containing protein n=1 Tax=Mesorhabditis belari TaxID=2138241 RepID=A0AAF3J4C0_9BILA